MPNHTAFRLNRSGMLLALISAAFAGEAAAATGGRVDFATAGATVAGNDGRQRPLIKGNELGTGDTVRTDAEGRAQIRFSDGSYVSLQPNTEFAIKDYKFDGKTDGSETGIFGLAKGAMRTVTGLIGRVNRNRYQITTPTATVGIRGTGGRIEVLNDGSTLIAGTSGIWTLSNPSGTLDIPAGTFGKAPSAPNQPPQKSDRGPDTGPTPLPVDPPKPVVQGIEKVVDQSCQTNPTGAACIISIIAKNPNPPLVTGTGYNVNYAYGDAARALNGAMNNSTNASATFNSTGQLTQFSGGLNSASFTGTHMEFGTSGGVIAWGRWIGPANVVDGSPGPGLLTGFNPGVDTGYHYVVGLPTAVMPTSGTATYTLVGATKPTYADGSATPGTFSGSLSVTFGGITTVNGNFAITGMGDGRGYAITGTGCTASSSFQLVTSVTGSGGACGCGCSSNVQGFFAGASAERAGVNYHISDSFKNVVGAAAFTK